MVRGGGGRSRTEYGLCFLSAQQTAAGLFERAKAAALDNKVCENRVDFYLGT